MRRSLLLAPVLALALGAPARGADSDAAFVAKAANSGMLEVELGDYAAKNALDPDVRAFGTHMSADHAKANHELTTLAESEGIAVDKELDAEHAQALSKLTAEKGADFDRDYAAFMVKAHQDAVATFQAKAAEHGSALDKWAATTLPTLESHLSMARDLDRQVNRTGATETPPPTSVDERNGAGPQLLP